MTRLTEPAEGEIAEDSKTDTDSLKTTKLMYEGMLGEHLIIWVRWKNEQNLRSIKAVMKNLLFIVFQRWKKTFFFF